MDCLHCGDANARYQIAIRDNIGKMPDVLSPTCDVCFNKAQLHSQTLDLKKRKELPMRPNQNKPIDNGGASKAVWFIIKIMLWLGGLSLVIGVIYEGIKHFKDIF